MLDVECCFHLGEYFFRLFFALHLIQSVESCENILLHAHNVLCGLKTNGKKNRFDIRSKAFARRLLFVFCSTLSWFLLFRFRSVSFGRLVSFKQIVVYETIFVYELDANVCDTHNTQPKLNKTFEVRSTSAISNSIHQNERKKLRWIYALY